MVERGLRNLYLHLNQFSLQIFGKKINLKRKNSSIICISYGQKLFFCDFLIILNINMFKTICLLTIVISCMAGIAELKQQIENTQQLIYLYQQKLRILQDIYESNYPDSYHRTKGKYQRKNLLPIPKQSSQLVLINQFNYSSVLFQDQYLLSNNQIISLNNKMAVAEYMGEVIIVQNSLITTILGGKINLVQFKQDEGKIKKEEYLLGLNGEKLESIWHRNYNIKDGEDLLIQWQENKIFFRGKEVNTITLQLKEKIISIYSLNQYKIIFVSTHRIGIINSRSVKLGQYENAQNITKIKKNTTSQVKIIQSYRQDNFIILLLSTGQLAKYYNEKIVNIQILPGLSQQSNLAQQNLMLQYIHPYLFVANKNNPSIKAYQNQGNRFNQILYVTVQSTNPIFHFFKQNDSYRTVISSQNITKIYEIILPTIEEVTSGTNYFKFIGIVAVVVCFIYFKWFKKGNDQNELLERKQLLKKQAQLEKIRSQIQDRTDIIKQKNKHPQSQAEEFLRKQPREQHKKIN